MPANIYSDVKSSFKLRFEDQAHLFQPVKVVLVNLELEAFLEASPLWHLNIHWTYILFSLVLPFLSQTTKVAK